MLNVSKRGFVLEAIFHAVPFSLVDNYFTFHDNLEKKSLKDESIIASFEPVQKMKFYMPPV